ncbi:MAG: endonuclease VII domain-containing protein [Actinomycetota bacterium]|nr:endonuclease VII domain-containing protein [Actinomycetota bacterium]
MTKPPEHFYRARDMRDGRRNDCIECNRAQRKAWYSKNRDVVIAKAKRWQEENRERHLASQRKRREENREELRERDRKRWLAAKYGLTPESFNELLESQNHACAICGTVMGEDLHVDHDHKWNRVRGLLCGRCNRGIGLLKENPTFLHRAGNYITEFKLTQYERYLEPLTRPLDQIPVK